MGSFIIPGPVREAPVPEYDYTDGPDSVPVITKQEVAREKARHTPITSTQRGNPPIEQGREVTYCANLNCREDWPCTAYRLCEWYEATLVDRG